MATLSTTAHALGAIPAPEGMPPAGNLGRWAMFAEPPGRAEWYVAEAEAGDGTWVDALHGGAPQWDHPVLDPTRWRKFLSGVSEEPRLVASLAAYLCSGWLEGHGSPLGNLTLYRVEYPIPWDGPRPDPSAHLLGRQDCRAA